MAPRSKISDIIHSLQYHYSNIDMFADCLKNISLPAFEKYLIDWQSDEKSALIFFA